MSALNKSFLAVLFASLAGCGQQLVEFGGSNPGGGLAPTVTSTDPLDTSTGVGVSRTVNATFSEAMDPASISTATFTLKQGSTPISGSVRYAGMTATFQPASDLSNNLFTATVSTGAKSAASATSLKADYTWTFSTSSVAGARPSVNSTDPGDRFIDVATNKQVSAIFSKVMDPASINAATFTLKQGTTPIPGAVSYAGTTATFAPTSLLGDEKVYDAMISSGAKDLAGRGLVADYSWSFTTLRVPAMALAINLRGAASFGLASRAGLTSTGVTVVNGDVALHPLASCTDSTGGAGNASQSCLVQTYSSSTGMTVNGKIYWAGDPFDNGGTANSVTNDLQIAWNEGKGKVDTKGPVAGDQMALKTFNPGIYHNANLGLSAGGVATLDAQNDANAIFIFKVDSSFVDSGTLLLKSRIDLINGAQARNVWFVAGLDITIGSGTTWNGNILAGRTATVLDGSTVIGRVLAGASGAGAITLTGAASPSKTTITVPR